MNFKDLGWNNLLFRVPEDARLKSESGNAQTGYMRLESDNYFFEVKWEEARTKNIKPISKIVELFIKKLEKDSKKKILIKNRFTAVDSQDLLADLHFGFSFLKIVFLTDRSIMNLQFIRT